MDWLFAIVLAAVALAAAVIGSFWLGAAAAAGILLVTGLGVHHYQSTVAATAPPANDAAGRQLQAVLDGISEGILAVDADQRLLFANAAARHMLDLPPLPPQQPQLFDFLPWPQLHRAVASCIGSAQQSSFETAYGTETSPRTLAVLLTPLRQPGGVDGALVVLDDRSQLRRLESHRRDFIANVSHELKTPLAAILGLVETLIDDPEVPPARRQDFLAKIHRQSERLNRLVADLLTLSRLDEERFQVEPGEPTDFAAMVQEVQRDLRPLAEKRGVRFLVEIGPGPFHVAAEPEALRQVIGNLVDNAIKYTPAGGSVWVRLRPLEGRILLEVEDTGVGLSLVDQERVFERFYRVDKARSREVGGTGLGLAIVKNTVAGLGGVVGVRSTLGKGSTFWVTLPPAPNGASEP